MPSVSLDVEAEHNRPPSIVLLPNTPPFQGKPPYQSYDYVEPTTGSDNLHVPSIHDGRHRPSREPQPTSQPHILTALAVGAPLIASVVSSCTSVVCADLTAALGADPRERSARASAVVALLWCALVTSLGATMTAVAGLAMHAGYHDSHVGITKKIVRTLRQWKKGRSHSRSYPQDHERHEGSASHMVDMRAHSPALSTITDGHKSQHAAASFRAAVVSARLLGTSVALLSIALAVYLFLLYPLPVAISTLVVGVITAASAAAPLLPILKASNS